MSRTTMVLAVGSCSKSRVRPPTHERRPVDLGELGDRLSALRLCDPAALERMSRALSRHGQLTAVTAFDDGELLQVVDGFKRVHAAQRLGWRALVVCVVELSEAEATAAIRTMHQHGELTELEEGWSTTATTCTR